MNLNLFILLPLLTALAILPAKGLKQIRTIALTGSALQLLLSFALLIEFWKERAAGNVEQMLFQQEYKWFAALNINYHIGIDGISVSMILLTAFVVLAAVLVSWKMPDRLSNLGGEKLSKEFFFLLILKV